MSTEMILLATVAVTIFVTAILYVIHLLVDVRPTVPKFTPPEDSPASQSLPRVTTHEPVAH